VRRGAERDQRRARTNDRSASFGHRRKSCGPRRAPEDYKTHREQQTDELIRKKHDGGLIYKERQNSLVSAALDLTDWHQWAAVMVKTLDDLTDQQGMLADELDTELGQNLRKQNDAMSKRINALENIVDDLAKRVEALQQSSGYEG
jgi:hypothetical protein